jgi:hypothetical protein
LILNLEPFPTTLHVSVEPPGSQVMLKGFLS